MRQGSRFARWISVALIIGLVVTCMPTTAAFASVEPAAAAGENDANDGASATGAYEYTDPLGGSDGSAGASAADGESQSTQNVREDESQTQEASEQGSQTQSQGAAVGGNNDDPAGGNNDDADDGNDGEQSESSELPPVGDSGVQWVEKSLTLIPELHYVARATDNELQPQDNGTVPIGTSESSEAYVLFSSEGESGEQFSKLISLLQENDVQLASAKLMFCLEEGEDDSSYSVNAYPIALSDENLAKIDKYKSKGMSKTDGFDIGETVGSTSKSEREEKGVGAYSIDVLNQISAWESSMRDTIWAKGYFGYALRLTM